MKLWHIPVGLGLSQLPPGWEWVWLEDPWTGKVEKLRIPMEEADARRRQESSPKPSYWGERETKEWRKKLREENERVERERRERLEWRIWEMQPKGQLEDSGR